MVLQSFKIFLKLFQTLFKSKMINQKNDLPLLSKNVWQFSQENIQNKLTFKYKRILSLFWIFYKEQIKVLFKTSKEIVLLDLPKLYFNQFHRRLEPNLYRQISVRSLMDELRSDTKPIHSIWSKMTTHLPENGQKLDFCIWKKWCGDDWFLCKDETGSCPWNNKRKFGEFDNSSTRAPPSSPPIKWSNWQSPICQIWPTLDDISE